MLAVNCPGLFGRIVHQFIERFTIRHGVMQKLPVADPVLPMIGHIRDLVLAPVQLKPLGGNVATWRKYYGNAYGDFCEHC